MKHLVPLLPLLLASCTSLPDVSETDLANAPDARPIGSDSEEREAETASNGETPPADQGDQGLRLLDPDVSSLPSKDDMESTVSEEAGPPVIATPPGDDD